MLRTQSDARLVDLVRAGHDSAFEAIVQRYRKPLLGYCSRLLPASRAEDAVQQTFLKAYQSMVSGDAELNLRPWLYRIAHNASLNLLRQNGWSHEELDENFDGVQRPDQALELRERLHDMVAAVNALPERQRDAMLLREIDGLSYEEIAAAMGVGDGAVRQLLHRARATLRAGMTAVTPVGLLERLASALAGTSGDPSARVAEVAAGFGLGAGAVKVGAAVLATGAIATGVAAVPLVKHHKQPRPHPVQAAEVPAAPATDAGPSAASPSHSVQVDDRRGSSHQPSDHGRHRGSGRLQHHGSSPHGGPGGGAEDRSGSPTQPQQRHGGGGEDRHSGSRHSGGDGSGGGSSGDGKSGGSDGGSAGGGTDDGGSDHSGSGDDGGGDTVTIPTGPTAITGPITEQSGQDGSGSGSGSSDDNSGSGSDSSGSLSGSN